jgi:hypothetical protein
MTRAARRASLVVVLLLASVATAVIWRGSVWVRWETIWRAGGTTTEVPGEVFESREKCETSILKRLVAASAKNSAVVRGEIWVSDGLGRPFTVTSYRCVPNIVDPRGPKGK